MRYRYRATGAAAVAALLLLGAVPAAGAAAAVAGSRAPSASGVEMVPGELLVRGGPVAKGGGGERSGRSLRHLGRAGGLDRVAVDTADPAAAAAEVMRSGQVAYAQPNYIYRSFSNDPAWKDQWGADNRGQTILGVPGTSDVDIDLPEAWVTTRGSSSVLVAVIDTGVDVHHPDLAANIFVNTAEKNGLPGIDDDGNGYVDDVNGWDFVYGDATVFDHEDEDFHGTHVAGTIAAVADNGVGVAGVAPQVRILPIKAIGPNGGSTSQVIDAVEYATAMGADIINASFGGQTSSADLALNDAIVASGAVFVAAAGNGGEDEVGDDNDTMLISPAGLPAPNIVSVAAVENTGRLAAFSNYGDDTVDVGAPGVSVVSLWPNNQYAWMDGTSMAAPHVAGVAALVRSKYPDVDADSTAQLVLASAKANPLTSLSGRTVTGGLANATSALEIAASGGDIVAPVWPSGAAISTTSVTSSGFTLSWPAASDAEGVAAYSVTVGDVVSVAVTTTSYKVTGLAAATTYPVSVVARDAAGNVSKALTASLTTAEATTAEPYSGDGPRSLDWACPELVSAGYTDVPATSPHLPGIDCASQWGVFLGGDSGEFVPAQKLSRAQLASVLARAIEQATGTSLVATVDHFVDDDTNVHQAAINALAELGIVGGYDGGQYRPGSPVTRAQFATMLAATYTHLTDVIPSGPNAFTDDDRSPHRGSIDGMAGLGVVGGVAVGKYDPAGVLTRAQAATMVARLLDALVEAGAAG